MQPALPNFSQRPTPRTNGGDSRPAAEALGECLVPISLRILDQLAEGVVIIDDSGRIVSTNPAADLLFGYAPGQLAGQHVRTLKLCAQSPVDGWEYKRPDGTTARMRARVATAACGERSYTAWVCEGASDHRPQDEASLYLAAIVESSNDAIMVEDLDGHVTSWNRAAEQMFGYEAEEMIGQSVAKLAPADRADEVPELLARIRRGERIEHYETKWRRKDGSEIDVSLTLSPVRDAAGRIVGVSKISRDITERVRAQELQRRLAAVVDSSDDAVISKDLNGIIQSWNRAAERIFGYKAEEVIGKPISILATAERIGEMPGILERLRRGEIIDHYETRRRHKDGHELIISLTVSPILDGNGKVIGASKIARDITERKRAEMAMQNLAAIVESSDDAIISKDLNGSITSWNNGAQRLFGYTAEEVLGKPVSILAAPGRVSEMPHILGRIRRGERVDHYETVRQTKDGRQIDISLTVSPILDANGKVIGASKIARDITDRKRSQEALKNANEALRRANADLEQFAYAAAHDLQEPLRMVKIYSQMLLHTHAAKLDENARECLGYCVEGADRIEALVRGLLEYTRLAGTAGEAVDLVDADATLREVLRTLHPAIAETGATVVWDKLPSVRMNELHLRQVLQNLISNALKYRSKDTPRVEISAEPEEGNWLFSVADNGIGIDPQYGEHIFGIFKRLHTNDEYAGTGIGLAICQRAVERYGGRIWVESELGKGSTFRFVIPG